ncbi:MAG: DUF1501 domain-containing protein [Akkermansiaceae bacterium]
MNTHKMNEVSRRGFLATTAKTCFGLSIGGSAASFFSQQCSAASTVNPAVLAAGGGKAKSVIYLFMSGGMSHVDTFDPKPDAGSSVIGDLKARSTNVDGIQLGHYLPQLAQQMDSVALIRSMNTTQGAHAEGRYFMRTGYTKRSSIVHPTHGSWAERLSADSPSELPNYVTVHCSSDHPGAGFMEAKYAPLPIGEASAGLQNSKRNNISEAEFQEQLQFRQELDCEFDAQFINNQKQLRNYNECFDSAVKLMKSEDLEAFDLGKEDKALHTLYGENRFGKGLLLARRLVERGVRFIEVEYGGFDWHDDAFDHMEKKIPVVDTALSALIADLKAKGMLDSTLIVLGTEFGRSPQINQNAGRNHFPRAFSCLMAGGGVQGGQVYGTTNETASAITKNKVTAMDFNATIGHALGIEQDKTIYSESKRPFRMAGKEGRPITQLFGA